MKAIFCALAVLLVTGCGKKDDAVKADMSLWTSTSTDSYYDFSTVPAGATASPTIQAFPVRIRKNGLDCNCVATTTGYERSFTVQCSDNPTCSAQLDAFTAIFRINNTTVQISAKTSEQYR